MDNGYGTVGKVARTHDALKTTKDGEICFTVRRTQGLSDGRIQSQHYSHLCENMDISISPQLLPYRGIVS